MSTIARIKRSLRGCRFKLSFGLIDFEEGFCLDFFGFLIALPFLDRWHQDPYEILDDWRIYYHERAIVFNWGRVKDNRRRGIYWYMPWDVRQVRHEVQRPDGSWVPYVGAWTDKEPDGRQLWTFDYRYTLNSGEVQERIATVYVERREYRQIWLKWCPLFGRLRCAIEFSFDGEVGERTGSWKGGVIGSGENMLPGETVEQCFRRMERERKF